jgi:hypothetical protein
MNIRGKMVKPEETEFALTITMKMKDWEDLRESIPDKWPFWKISSAISDMIIKVKTTFEEEIKGE